MNTAENISSARYAVGALALAALAVSAMAFTTPAPVPEPAYEIDDQFALDCFPDPVTTLGEIVVVGTDQYEPVTAALEQLVWALPRCTREAERITIYMHLEDGAASAIEVLGNNDTTTRCVAETVRQLHFDVDAPVDVMVPVDLVPR